MILRKTRKNVCKLNGRAWSFFWAEGLYALLDWPKPQRQTNTPNTLLSQAAEKSAQLCRIMQSEYLHRTTWLRRNLKPSRILRNYGSPAKCSCLRNGIIGLTKCCAEFSSSREICATMAHHARFSSLQNIRGSRFLRNDGSSARCSCLRNMLVSNAVMHFLHVDHFKNYKNLRWTSHIVRRILNRSRFAQLGLVPRNVHAFEMSS